MNILRVHDVTPFGLPTMTVLRNDVAGFPSNWAPTKITLWKPQYWPSMGISFRETLKAIPPERRVPAILLEQWLERPETIPDELQELEEICAIGTIYLTADHFGKDFDVCRVNGLEKFVQHNNRDVVIPGCTAIRTLKKVKTDGQARCRWEPSLLPTNFLEFLACYQHNNGNGHGPRKLVGQGIAIWAD